MTHLWRFLVSQVIIQVLVKPPLFQSGTWTFHVWFTVSHRSHLSHLQEYFSHTQTWISKGGLPQTVFAKGKYFPMITGRWLGESGELPTKFTKSQNHGCFVVKPRTRPLLPKLPHRDHLSFIRTHQALSGKRWISVLKVGTVVYGCYGYICVEHLLANQAQETCSQILLCFCCYYLWHRALSMCR